MQIRSFRGAGEPVWVIALLSAGFRLGPAPRRALGPAAVPAAPTGRTRDRTRPTLQAVKKFLPGRRPHVTQGRPCLTLARCALVRTIGRERLTTPKVQSPLAVGSAATHRASGRLWQRRFRTSHREN